MESFFIFAVLSLLGLVFWRSCQLDCRYEPPPKPEDVRHCAPARNEPECMRRLGYLRVCEERKEAP